MSLYGAMWLILVIYVPYCSYLFVRLLSEGYASGPTLLAASALAIFTHFPVIKLGFWVSNVIVGGKRTEAHY